MSGGLKTQTQPRQTAERAAVSKQDTADTKIQQHERRSEANTQPIQTPQSNGGLKQRHSRYTDTIEVRGKGNPNNASSTEDAKSDCEHKYMLIARHINVRLFCSAD